MAGKNNITKFSNSLSEYLIDMMTDKHGDAKHFAYRYNNLKVFMDPSKVSDPHFFVSLGISEACFSIDDGKKLEGALGHEDGLVARWAGRTNIQSELKLHWKAVKDAIAAETETEETKKRQARFRLRRAETEDANLNVDMTGTGINRVKAQERKRRELTKKVGTDDNLDDNSDISSQE